jgi:hypothetical protein
MKIILFIPPRISHLAHVAASDTSQPEPTNMKLPPEPPLWLGATIAALIGFAFIGAVIALHYLTR